MARLLSDRYVAVDSGCVLSSHRTCAAAERALRGSRIWHGAGGFRGESYIAGPGEVFDAGGWAGVPHVERAELAPAEWLAPSSEEPEA